MYLTVHSRHLSIKKNNRLFYLMETRFVFCEVHWIFAFNIDQFYLSTRWEIYVYRSIEARSRNHCCSGKAMNIIYSVCVCVTLVIQRADLMLYIILSSVAYPTVPHFSTSSNKRHDFSKKNLNIQCVFRFSLQLLSENFCHSKKNSATYRSLNSVVA